MKKIIYISVIILLFVNITSVFATSTTNITKNNATGDMEVIYTVEDGYLISIPESFNLEKDKEVVKTIHAEDVYIEYGTKLQITVSGANCSGDSSWYIVDEEEGNNKNRYEYTIGTQTGDADIEDDATILTVEAGELEGSQKLYFNLKDEVTKSGTYSDILTFEAEIVES